MSEAISPQQAADHAAIRMEAAIQRHTGWQLEYDFTMVVNDRKRLIDELAEARARVAELEGEREQARQIARHLRSDLTEFDGTEPVDYRVRLHLGLSRDQSGDGLIDWLTSEPRPAAAPDRSEGSGQ